MAYRLKKEVLFFLAVLLIFPAAGAEAVEISIWNMPPEADKNRRVIWEETVEKFQTRYPSVKVNGISREYKPQEFVSVMASGKGPDIVRIPVTAIPAMAKYGFLAKLNFFVEKWMQKDYMPDIMWKGVEIKGDVYGIPYDSFFTTLFYRKSIFKECGIKSPPRDWEELAVYARKVSREKEGVWGIALAPSMFNFIDFIWQAGGDVYGSGGLELNNPGVLRALHFWRDLKWKYGVMPPGNIYYDNDIEQLFSSGKIAMMTGVADRLPVMKRRYGLDIKDVEIVPLPAGPEGIKAWHAGGEVFIMNSDMPDIKKKYAWSYIEYVLSPPYQLWKWVRMNQLRKKIGMVIFPGDFSSATNLINMKEFENVKGLLAFAQTEPTFYKWPMIKEDFNRYVLEKIFSEKNADIEKTLYEFSEWIEEEYYGR